MSDVVYRAIRQEIMSGARPEDSWLREGDLADELGVSRTPVREALRRLAAEGVVRHEPNRGVRVESWSAAQVDEIFTLRAVLEPLACSLAATVGQLDVHRLRTLAERMDRAALGEPQDLEALTRSNNEFHRLIVEGSGNSRLVGIIASLIEIPLVHRTFERYSDRSLRRSLAHHHELIHAFEARDPEWAESVMRSHVRAAWSTVHAAPSDNPDEENACPTS